MQSSYCASGRESCLLDIKQNCHSILGSWVNKYMYYNKKDPCVRKNKESCSRINKYTILLSTDVSQGFEVRQSCFRNSYGANFLLDSKSDCGTEEEKKRKISNQRRNALVWLVSISISCCSFLQKRKGCDAFQSHTEITNSQNWKIICSPSLSKNPPISLVSSTIVCMNCKLIYQVTTCYLYIS